MKRILVTLMVALFSVLMVVPEADARRMGGGRSIGKQSDMMKRDAARPPAQSGQQATQQPPASSAAAGAAGRRSWMGPIAGIAAGLGLAALASHLGLGEEFGTILLMALVFIVILVAVRMFMARRNGSAGVPRPAYAGAGAGHGGAGARGQDPAAQPWAARSGRPGEGAGNGSAWAPQAGAAAGAAASVPATVTAPASGDVPADFDADRFIHAAKVNFVRLQTAFDNNRADDLREFTSPEMFAELSLDLMQRGQDDQTTDVVTLDARLLGVEQADLAELASVRFEGMLREGSEQAAKPFVEVWNFTRPIDRSSGWVLAGIQQVS